MPFKLKGRILYDNALRSLRASEIQENPYRCPHCESTTINITCYYKRAFVQKFVDGKTEEKDLTMDNEALQEMVEIECLTCNTGTIVEDDEVYNREVVIFNLQLQIAMLQGKVVANVEGKKELIQ